ncbi:MAG: secretin N-terminal domain-containing protein [Gemmatimonadota bacterium]
MKRISLGALVLAAGLVAVSPLRAEGPASGEVTGVSVMPAPGRADIVINVRGAVEVKDFSLREPDRLVIDVVGARLNGGVSAYDGVNRSGILDVKYAQFRPDVVRIAIYLTGARPYKVERVGDAVHVSFGSEGGFLAWSSTSPAQMTPPAATVTPPVRTKPEVSVAPEPADAAVVAEPRITVTWDKADIADVVAGFAAFSGRTIILGKDIKGTISAEIHNQPWHQAFQAVLQTQGLQAVELPGGIIRVDSPQALAALDSIEPLETRIVRINYAPAAGLVTSMKSVLTKRGQVVSDTTTNSLIITDTRSRIADAERFVRGLDIRTPQVSIQSKLVFVDRTDLQSLGLQYDLGDKDVYFNKVVARPDPTDPTTPLDPTTVVVGGNSIAAMGNANGVLTGSALDVVWRTAIGGFSFTSFLHALQTVTLADIQAEPLVTTLDNRQALINVGQEIPVRVIDPGSLTANTGPKATVSYKNVGIIMQVTPHITNNRHVLMTIHAERSSLSTIDVEGNFVINKQFADNQLLVADGETAVIGGLTVTEVNKNKSGIPFLVDLPIVGALFGYSTVTEHRQDLIILITPRIIDEGSE